LQAIANGKTVSGLVFETAKAVQQSPALSARTSKKMKFVNLG
jgi:hypothetical protein